MTQEELLEGLSEQEKFLLIKILEIEKNFQNLPSLSGSREKDVTAEIVAQFKKAYPK